MISLKKQFLAFQRALTMNPIDFGRVAKSYARPREDIPINLMNSLLICAENTGLQDSYFDMVTVMRAWHWFDHPAAL